MAKKKTKSGGNVGMCTLPCPDCADPYYAKPGGRIAPRNCTRCKGTGTVREMKRTCL